MTDLCSGFMEPATNLLFLYEFYIPLYADFAKRGSFLKQINRANQGLTVGYFWDKLKRFGPTITEFHESFNM